jgi:hypothetical protein
MEVLSKQEVAQNVLDYYVHRKEDLSAGLESYDELQGGGFVCWRFLMNDAAKAKGGAKVATQKRLKVGSNLDELDP